MSVPPRREGDRIVIARVYPVSVERVWEALTVSEHTAPWFGPYSGDPTSGQVQVVMVAEESDTPVTMHIDECTPHERLALRGEGDMDLLLTVSRVGDGTMVELGHRITDPAMAGAYGAGWEFYLDRLGASLTGGVIDAIDFSAYHPHLEEKYRRLAE